MSKNLTALTIKESNCLLLVLCFQSSFVRDDFKIFLFLSINFFQIKKKIHSVIYFLLDYYLKKCYNTIVFV